MSERNRRLQVPLDQDCFHRQKRQAGGHGDPGASVTREAVDRFLAEETERRAAGGRLLAASLMAVDYWYAMKDLLEAAGRGWRRAGERFRACFSLPTFRAA